VRHPGEIIRRDGARVGLVLAGRWRIGATGQQFAEAIYATRDGLDDGENGVVGRKQQQVGVFAHQFGAQGDMAMHAQELRVQNAVEALLFNAQKLGAFEIFA
jgi:hypothetical protein